MGLFRLWNHVIGTHVPCHCLGSLTAWLPLQPYVIDWLTDTMFMFLLLPSLCLLLTVCMVTRHAATE
jgi:hypothetical protein